MTWNTTMGLLSSIALFAPIAVIVWLRLTAFKTFPALLIYYIIIFSYNIFTEEYIHIDPQVVYYMGLVNNLLDAPLMMTFLLYFSPSVKFSHRLKFLIIAFLIFEAIILTVFGLNINAITIILGPGLILTTSLCVLVFIRQTKIAIVNLKALGRSMIAAALCFAYGCYGLIYVLFYLNNSPNVEDTFLVYYWASLISATLLSSGVLIEYKRILKLHELKRTRQELSSVYSQDKSPMIISKVKLDFEVE